MSGIDTKKSTHESLHTALTIFLLLEQYLNKFNDTYLTRFELSVKALNLVGGSHIFTSEKMLGKKISSATDKELEAERENFKAIHFILRANGNRLKNLRT